MFTRSLLVALFATMAGPAGSSVAEEPTARVVKSHGYSEAVELKLGKTRAVLCPQAGGRVLEFSVDGTDAMYFDADEKNWQPGKPGPITAGRFDFGPELTVAPHPKAWAGVDTTPASPEARIPVPVRPTSHFTWQASGRPRSPRPTP